MTKCVAIVTMTVMILGMSAGIVAAQTGENCEDVAGNGYQLCGPFRAQWDSNDGAAVFGVPLSDAFVEEQFQTGDSLEVQYFERQRFELHPEQAGTPYEVLLGRLGADVLAAAGEDWAAYPKDDPSSANYQAATGFAIASEFIDFWSGNGLEFSDAGVSFRESLALFGYPISPAQSEVDEDGNTVLVQWFERARLELRDGQVTAASLGAELLAVPGVTDPVVASMVAQVQRSVARFGDLDVALEEGWGLVEGLDHCFISPGVGAMGYHYINVDLLDTSLDPLAPEAMVYQPDADGELSFGAVEWIVPAEAWDAEGHAGPPELMGHRLHLNEELGVYVLHSWLFLENPAGIFEDWNPNVSCPS